MCVYDSFLSLTHLRSEGALEAVRVSSIAGIPSSVEGRELGTSAPLVISGRLSSEGDLGEERVIISMQNKGFQIHITLINLNLPFKCYGYTG